MNKKFFNMKKIVYEGKIFEQNYNYYRKNFMKDIKNVKI